MRQNDPLSASLGRRRAGKFSTRRRDTAVATDAGLGLARSDVQEFRAGYQSRYTRHPTIRIRLDTARLAQRSRRP